MPKRSCWVATEATRHHTLVFFSVGLLELISTSDTNWRTWKIWKQWLKYVLKKKENLILTRRIVGKRDRGKQLMIQLADLSCISKFRAKWQGLGLGLGWMSLLASCFPVNFYLLYPYFFLSSCFFNKRPCIVYFCHIWSGPSAKIEANVAHHRG